MEPVMTDALDQGTATASGHNEAIDDALAELDRMDRSRKLADAMSPLDSLPLSQPVGIDMDAGRIPVPEVAPTKARAIEDLYANHPEVGTDKFLRIERKQPEMWQGHKISGFLDDVSRQITTREFVSEYGGGTYVVSVLGKSRGFDQNGTPCLRTLEWMKLEIPGMPNVYSLPGWNNKDAMQHQHPYAYIPGTNGQERIREMELNAAERVRHEVEKTRLQEQLTRNQGAALPVGALEHLETISEKRAAEMRMALQDTLGALRRENEKLNESVERRDQKIAELQAEMFKVQTETTTRLREHESEQVRILRERYESEKKDMVVRHEGEIKRVTEQRTYDIQRLQEDHAKYVKDTTERHERDVKDNAERHAREIREMQERNQVERDKTLADAQRRENQLTTDSQRREKDMQDRYELRLTELGRNHEQRLNDVERSYRRELDSVKEQRDRELKAVEMTERGQTTIIRESTKIQQSALLDELARARNESEGHKRELGELRSKVNKTPIEAIREAHELVEITGGGAKEEEGDWKKYAANAVREAIGKLPDTIKAFGEASRVPPQVQQQQMRRVAHPMQQPRGLPPPSMQAQQPMHPQQPRMSGGYVPAPQAPGWGAPPRPGPGASVGMPPPPAAPIAMTPPPQPVQSSWVAGPPEPRPGDITSANSIAAPSNNLASPLDDSPPATPPASAQPPPSVMTTNPPPQQPQEGMLQITDQQAGEFLGHLNMAIATSTRAENGDWNGTPPAQFAEQFIQRVGAHNVRAVVSGLTPEKVLQTVQSAPQGNETAIVTREGRKYVHELWDECKRQTGIA